MRWPRSDQQQLGRTGELIARIDDLQMSFEIRMARARWGGQREEVPSLGFSLRRHDQGGAESGTEYSGQR